MQMPLRETAAASRPTIGAAIITRNEEQSLERCLQSLSWVNEIVVVDDCSTDRTVEIARSLGCRVVTRPLRSFAEQRTYALSLLSTDWVLHLDADEECKPALRDEILSVLGRTDRAGFTIPFRSRFLGKVMRCSDWSRHKGLRLGKRSLSSWKRAVHESLYIDGPVGHLHEQIEHHGDGNYAARVTKSNRYTSFEASLLANQGVRFRIWRVLLIPLFRTFRSYFLNGGWRDGMIGLFWAGHVWWGNFAIYVKLWELERQGISTSTPPPRGS